MTWATRFKLFFGTLGVLVIIAALTFVYTERESSATSQSATITATELPIGTDYAGKIVEQHVEEGAHVAEGDVLFTIDSLARQQDLEREAEAEEREAKADAQEAEAADVANASSPEAAAPATASSSSSDEESSDGGDEEFSPLWTVTASAYGTVAEVPTAVGGYVPAGGIVAQVYEEGSLYISADFVLTPRDFDRLQLGAPVEVRLPDRSIVVGSIEEIEVATEEGAARAFVRVDSDEITDSDPAGLTAPGTPVTATVDLRDDGPLAGLRDAATDFLEQIGL
ncbi:HlyD family efflux transporter periplasmic adaptor subunit [Demequina sp. SO4-18]|uniref:HlyD family efflux transporter periplasmic adaptor subunit n=1 Tax=Demequina sp. SO4-18 TaxID=3401026 RepID=UPI003B5CED98